MQVNGINLPKSRPVEILLVEDNPGDIFLAKEALKESKVNNNMHIAEDGVEAMEFLEKAVADPDTPLPDLILLDLNMPRMDGREVLQNVKNDERLRRIPIVVMTSSEEDEDILKAYELHANCYIQKPVDLSQFIKVVDTIDEFFLSIVKLSKV